jgi:hypothetical protein
MPTRKRGRRLFNILLVSIGILIADMLAIAAAEAVTAKFPPPLRFIQRN